MNKWISIKEQPPKENQIIVVWLKKLKEPATVRVENQDGNLVFIEFAEVDIWCDREDIVEYWYPLPEPPNE